MLLSRFLIEVYATERGITKSTRYQYARAITLYEEFLGCPCKVWALDRQRLVDWLDWLATKYAPATVADCRRQLLVLWRAAAARDLCKLPGTIRPVKVPHKIPTAWTAEEMSRLLAIAPPDLRTMLLAGYQTGLRRGDLLKVEVSQIEDDGTCWITQNKTACGHVCQLDQETVVAIRQRGNLKIPLRTFYKRLRKLCEQAGVRYGAFQMLRRTGATQIEINQPGAARRYLGHSTPGLAERYYIDWSQVQQPVRPPRIQ